MKAVRHGETSLAYLVFEGKILVDGKTGDVALFSIAEVMKCNGGWKNEVYRVVQAMKNPSSLRCVN